MTQNNATYSKESGDEVFPHDEYHLYVLDAHKDKLRHIHLPEDIVQDARNLIDTDYPVDRTDWNPKFWHHLGDGINFMFCPLDPDHSAFYYCSPFGDLGGGPHRISGVLFNTPVWFDSSFLCESTGPPADKEQHHYRDIRENIVLPEHRDQYMSELIEWEENSGWDTDWIDEYHT